MKHTLALLMTVMAVLAFGEQDLDAVRAANRAFVLDWHAQNQEAAATNSNLTALPGVLIDHHARTITFYAEATDITLRDPVEFFLIGEQSGNAYEALAVALAEPKDIHAGILALGLPPGRSANPAQLRFWPKGERVIMTMNGTQAEKLLLDTRTGRPLSVMGLVFTASSLVPPEDGQTAELAAQVRPPFSIASNYNEQNSLLDVPRRAPQSAVYSHQARNPEIEFEPGQRLMVVITPEYPEGQWRIRELGLAVGTLPPENGRGSLAHARFTLTEGNESLLHNVTLDQLLAAFSSMIDRGQDPCVEIHVDDSTPMGTLRDVALVLTQIETENGIRVEPPPAGTLYYQAFTPDERFRRREDRHMHPWELRLTDGILLTRIDEHWTRGKPKPDITSEDFALETPEALADIMTRQKPDVRAIFVYVPTTLKHGDLMRILAPIRNTHPLIHVYVEDSPEPELAANQP